MERLKTTYFTLLALTISMFQGLVFPFIMMFHKKKPCNIQKRLFEINHSATKPYKFAIQFWLIRSIQQIHKSHQSTFFFHIISPTEKPPCSNLVRGWNTLKHHMSSYLTPTRNTKIAVDSLYKFPNTTWGEPSPKEPCRHIPHRLRATNTWHTGKKKISSHPGWLINPFLLQL